MHRRKGRFARLGNLALLAALPAVALSACGDDVTPLPLLPANGPAPQVLPIRRLTNAEYTASVTDLFPGIKLPDLTFVPDTKILGFSNLSSSR